VVSDQTFVLGSEAREGGHPINVTDPPRDVAAIGMTQEHGSIDHGLEHLVEVEGRSGNRLDHVVDRRRSVLRLLQLELEASELIVCVDFAHPVVTTR
jgi:hypothetical protein